MKKRCEPGLPDPLALHVLGRFYQVLASALVQNIEGVDDRAFLELSLVIVNLIDLEAHHICTSLDKYYFIDLLKLFRNLVFCWYSPHFKHIEDLNDKIRVIFVLKCKVWVLKSTANDLVTFPNMRFQIRVVLPDNFDVHSSSLCEPYITTLFVQR